MPLFKVVKRYAVYEDQVFFVEAPDEETACQRIRRVGPPIRIEKSQEETVAAAFTSGEERKNS